MCDITVNAELKRDPTRTKALRQRFEAEAYKRFRRLKGRIRDAIVQEDGFGLKANRGRFEFERSDKKVEAFMEWLRQAQRDEILEIRQGVPVSQAASQAWTATYIRTAYQRGVSQAAGNLRKQGVNVEDSWVDNAFSRPVHADRVGLAFTRAYQELEGITEAMDQQISRELAQGLAEGQNPRVIASRINDRVDKVGITRARTLARTEVISSHAEANLNAYEEAGVEGVEVEAEWSTAGDGRVCPECEAMEGETFTIEQARGMIPLHPNCRCTFLPRVEGGSGIELK